MIPVAVTPRLGFAADLRSAAHALINQPSLLLVSLVVALLFDLFPYSLLVSRRSSIQSHCAALTLRRRPSRFEWAARRC